MSFKVIGLIGSAGHGKDTVAEMILSKRSRFKRIAFADRLKMEISKLFGDFPAFQVEFDHRGRLSYRISREEMEPQMESLRRRIYQVWGTEGRRYIDEEWWLKEWAAMALEAATEGFEGVVVPDVRFPNEFEFLDERFAACTVLVDRGDYRRDGVDYRHGSERYVSEIGERARFRVHNKGTLEDLQEAVRLLLVRIEKTVEE